jgi:hypothetical protein
MPKTTNTHPEGVPLNIWLIPRGPGGESAMRYDLAARAVDAYSPAGGLVADLVPGDGEALVAAVVAGRGVASLPGDGAVPAGAYETADVALGLPAADGPRPAASTSFGRLAARAAAVLRPGGFLVAAVGAKDASGDPVTEAVGAAAEEGLAFFQHVVAVVCDPDPTNHINVLVFEKRRPR